MAMSNWRSIQVCLAQCLSVAGVLALATFLILGTPIAAMAIDCSIWTPAQGEQRDQAFSAAVDELLSSQRAQQWTTLNTALIKDCLLAFRGRIQIEWDGLCAKGMQTSMEALDNKLYEYARGCVRA
jgi:hypothetical protein